jgi:hypothetical protein
MCVAVHRRGTACRRDVNFRNAKPFLASRTARRLGFARSLLLINEEDE